MGWAIWGICLHRALNRIPEVKGRMLFFKRHVRINIFRTSWTMVKKTVAVQLGEFNRAIQLDCAHSALSEHFYQKSELTG